MAKRKDPCQFCGATESPQCFTNDPHCSDLCRKALKRGVLGHRSPEETRVAYRGIPLTAEARAARAARLGEEMSKA